MWLQSESVLWTQTKSSAFDRKLFVFLTPAKTSFVDFGNEQMNSLPVVFRLLFVITVWVFFFALALYLWCWSWKDVNLKSWPSGGVISLCLSGLALDKNNLVFELTVPLRRRKVEAYDTATSPSIHPCMKAECTVSYLQTFKWFLGTAV